MAYVDKSIKDYVEAIRENFDNACIFIFGDHPQIQNESFRSRMYSLTTKGRFVPLFV